MTKQISYSGFHHSNSAHYMGLFVSYCRLIGFQASIAPLHDKTGATTGCQNKLRVELAMQIKRFVEKVRAA